MENKAQSGAAKWQPPRPVTGLAAPLAWGANLWLLALVWPLISRPASGRLTLAAAAALAALCVGALAARIGRTALSGAVLLLAFPCCVAFGLSARGTDALEPLGLLVLAISLWLFGATAARALAGSGDTSVALMALPNRSRRPAAASVLRRARLRTALALLIGSGALAITVIAPALGPVAERERAWGASASAADVLIAIVAAAIASGTTAVFLSGALRPLSAFERRPPSLWRAAIGLSLAILSATTYYVLRPG